MPEESSQGLYQYGGLSIDNDQGAEVGGLLGILGRGLNNAKGITAQNQFNALEAQKARDFEQYMSSTAYQRAAADMKKAGINPASLSGLASSSGSGASTPSGHSASSSSGASGTGVIGTAIKAILMLAAFA